MGTACCLTGSFTPTGSSRGAQKKRNDTDGTAWAPALFWATGRRGGGRARGVAHDGRSYEVRTVYSPGTSLYEAKSCSGGHGGGYRGWGGDFCKYLEVPWPASRPRFLYSAWARRTPRARTELGREELGAQTTRIRVRRVPNQQSACRELGEPPRASVAPDLSSSICMYVSGDGC